MKHTTVLLFGAVVLSAMALPLTARAQDASGEEGASLADRFSAKGTMIVSAERAFGVTTTAVSADGGGGNSQTEHQTQFGLLWGSSGSAFTVPRLGFDVVVVDHVTVGGSVGFVTGSSSVETNVNGQSSSQDGPKSTTLAFAPRGGYLFQWDNLGLWLRGGFTYWSTASEGQASSAGGASGKSTTTGFAIDLEPTFLWSPVTHFAFTAGVVLDVPISGSVSADGGGSADRKVSNAGVVAGLCAWF